jgi:hypothetical protein
MRASARDASLGALAGTRDRLRPARVGLLPRAGLARMQPVGRRAYASLFSVVGQARPCRERAMIPKRSRQRLSNTGTPRSTSSHDFQSSPQRLRAYLTHRPVPHAGVSSAYFIYGSVVGRVHRAYMHIPVSLTCTGYALTLNSL